MVVIKAVAVIVAVVDTEAHGVAGDVVVGAVVAVVERVAVGGGGRTDSSGQSGRGGRSRRGTYPNGRSDQVAIGAMPVVGVVVEVVEAAVGGKVAVLGGTWPRRS